MNPASLVEVVEVSRAYGVGTHRVVALDGLTLAVTRGETLAIVGESGSGKSTLGRMLLGIERPDRGVIRLEGRALNPPLARPLRRRLQVVQQNPLSTLNPRRTVGQSIALPLEVHGLAGGRAGRARRVAELLDLVGLPSEFAARFPVALSGGQRQRAALARALAAEPDLVVLDEPTSALDVSVQARVLHLLVDLQVRFRLTYAFITHDLAVVRTIALRVAVLYRGRLVETGPTAAVFAQPRHRYTALLLSAIPVISEAEARLRPRWPAADTGVLVEPDEAGCAFQPRCPFALDICRRERPVLGPQGAAHLAACHNPGDGAA